jgi:hypothetical protein
MNPKRLAAAIVAVFITVSIADFLIHGVWLKNDYASTASLWRPGTEMQAHMGWLMLGQLLCSVAFTLLWAKGFAENARSFCAVMFGLCTGIFAGANTLATYAVQPLPGSLAAKWFFASIAECVLVAFVLLFVYKSKTPQAASEI